MSEDREFALNYKYYAAGSKWRVVKGSSHKKGIDTSSLCTY